MTWREGYGLLRLLSEERTGQPSRAYERAEEARHIAEMAQTLPRGEI